MAQTTLLFNKLLAFSVWGQSWHPSYKYLWYQDFIILTDYQWSARLNLLFSQAKWPDSIWNSWWYVPCLGHLGTTLFLIDFDRPDLIGIRFPTSCYFPRLLFQHPQANTWPQNRYKLWWSVINWLQWQVLCCTCVSELQITYMPYKKHVSCRRRRTSHTDTYWAHISFKQINSFICDCAYRWDFLVGFDLSLSTRTF